MLLKRPLMNLSAASAAHDGLWQKRGRTSLNGVVAVTSVYHMLFTQQSGKLICRFRVGRDLLDLPLSASLSPPDRERERKRKRERGRYGSVAPDHPQNRRLLRQTRGGDKAADEVTATAPGALLFYP
ncbi:Protein of unknown function [Gryllus bimaculatus]|nr:Protein of unknown function [Gryllus bimaculatus]